MLLSRIFWLFFTVASWLLLLVSSLFGYTAPSFNLAGLPELLAVSVGAGLFMHTRAFERQNPDTERILQKKFVGISKLFLLFWLMFFVQFVLTGFHHYKSDRGLVCLVNMGFFERLECFLQAATNQQTFVRSFVTFSSVVWLLGTASYAIRRGSSLYFVLLKIFAFYSAFFILLHLYLYFARPAFLLPQWVMTPDFVARLGYVVQNPTWQWPLIGGAFFLCFLLILKNNHVGLILRFVAFSCVVFLSVALQQRGALLQLVFFSLAVLTLWLFSSKVFGKLEEKHPILLKVKFPLVFSLLALAVPIYRVSYSALANILQWLGVHSRFLGEKVDSNERLIIWKSALLQMKEKPFFGHGYSSWYETMNNKFVEGGNSLLFDTPHNSIVELAFEFGVVYLFATAAFLYMVFIRRKRVYGWSILDSNRLILASALYLPILLVQELNFVRPTYIWHGFLWAGVLFIGASPVRERPVANAVKVKPAAIFAGVVGVLFSCAVFSLPFLIFSNAGYEFEANVHAGYEPKYRWFRSFGTLSSTTIARRDASQQFKIRKLLASNAATAAVYWNLPFSFERVSYQIPVGLLREGWEVNLVSPVFPFPWPPSVLKASEGSPSMGRDLSLLSIWPVHFSSLPVVASQGLFAWEKEANAGSGQARWCGRKCRLILLTCPHGTQRQLLLSIPSAVDHSSERVTVRASWGKVKNSASSASMNDLFLTLPFSQEVVLAPYSNGGHTEIKLISGDLNANKKAEEFPSKELDSLRQKLSDLEILELEVNKTFVPRGTDARELGVFILGSVCKSSM